MSRKRCNQRESADGRLDMTLMLTGRAYVPWRKFRKKKRVRPKRPIERVSELLKSNYVTWFAEHNAVATGLARLGSSPYKLYLYHVAISILKYLVILIRFIDIAVEI